MESNLTEFSYGYAVTDEIVNHHLKGRVNTAPYFPSLQDEGKEGGYDVKVSAIFLQFKLSDYLKSKKSKEMYLFGYPYYRMKLRCLKFSKQHYLLCNLERENPNQVFYIAPEFYEEKDLTNNFIMRKIIDNSALFSPLEIGYLDDEKHYIVFDDRSDFGYLCSDNPLKKSKKKLSNILEIFQEKSLKRLKNEMINILNNREVKVSSKILDNSELNDFEAINILAHHYFGCEVLFFQ